MADAHFSAFFWRKNIFLFFHFSSFFQKILMNFPMCALARAFQVKRKETPKMNKNSKRLGLYTMLMLALAAAGVALRTVAVLTDLDYEYGYFNNGTLMLISAIVVAAGAILLIALAPTMKPVSLKASFSTPSTYVPTGAVAVTLLSLSIALFGGSHAFSAEEMDTPYEVLCLFGGIFAIISVAHFFFNAFLTARHTIIRGYFALGTIIFLTIYASALYFDGETALNSPNKLVDQMAILATAVFFLYEARISLGREMWRAYSGFGLVAALLLAYAAIPELILYFARGVVISAHIEASVFLASLLVFVFMRLCLVMSLREEGESREVAILRAYAEEREAALHDEEKLRGKDDIQLTIDDLFGEEIATIPTDTTVEEIEAPAPEAPIVEADDTEEAKDD